MSRYVPRTRHPLAGLRRTLSQMTRMLARILGASARRTGTVLGIITVLVAATSGLAFAHWTSTGSGSASATTGTLNPPTSVVGTSTAGSGAVIVTWVASAAPSTPTGYYVTRIDSGSNTSAACNTSATATIGGLSCTDTPVSIGTYTYKVTAVYHSWTATSTASTGVTVAQGTQAITFTSTAPAGAAVGGSTYSVTATGGGSGNAVTFTIDGSATSLCSIAGSTVSFTAVGTCTINANQSGNGNYLAAPQKQQSFAIGKGAQTITFTSTAPSNASVGGSTYTVTATASSTLPVTLSLDGTSTGCSLSGSTSGSTVSLSSVGTCKVDANQVGNGTYLAAGQVQQSFAVAQGAQTIAFTSTKPSNATVGGSTYVVTASGGASGNPVTFTVDTTSIGVCSIAAPTVSFMTVGTCTIDANQASSTNYLAASQVQQSFAVGKGAQAITFTSTAPTTATVGGSPYTVTATASSGLAVVLSLDGTSTGCTLSGSTSGSTVSFPAAGNCIIDANQPGNVNYLAAGQLQQSFGVAKANQTITFTSTPVNPTFGGSYTVTATGGGSGNPVTLTSATPSVCTGAGSTVSFVGAGSCSINADQAGNANYLPAPQLPQTFTVAKANQTITFTSTAPTTPTVGSTYTPAATSTSALTVTITIDATSSSVCSISGGVVTFNAVGTCNIDANQSGNGNYSPAAQVQQQPSVAKANQTITITSAAPTSAKVGGSPYTLTATTTSSLSVAFTSATATVCTVSTSTVTFVGVGTCTINADQAGNTNYNAALQVQQSFAVTAAKFSVAAGASQIAGTSFAVTITAQTGGGATVASYNGSHTITLSATAGTSLSGATPTLPNGPLTFTNGVASVSVTLVKAEVGQTITATDGTINGTTGAIAVSAAGSRGMIITSATVKTGAITPACSGSAAAWICSALGATSGNSRQLKATITLVDQFGNVTTNNTGSAITVNMSGSGTMTPGTLSIANGASNSGGQFTMTLGNGSSTETYSAAASINGAATLSGSTN